MLAAGDALSPIRRLARELRIDPNTVVRAYRLLAAEGLAELRRGRRSRITRSAARTETVQRANRFEILLGRLAVEGELLGLTREDILFALDSHITLSQKNTNLRTSAKVDSSSSITSSKT
jgi:GntR family transcriptional regulator